MRKKKEGRGEARRKRKNRKPTDSSQRKSKGGGWALDLVEGRGHNNQRLAVALGHPGCPAWMSCPPLETPLTTPLTDCRCNFLLSPVTLAASDLPFAALLSSIFPKDHYADERAREEGGGRRAEGVL